eukprot:2262097-Pleurochrysis_carterae.AAC.1
MRRKCAQDVASIISTSKLGACPSSASETVLMGCDAPVRGWGTNHKFCAKRLLSASPSAES